MPAPEFCEARILLNRSNRLFYLYLYCVNMLTSFRWLRENPATNGLFLANCKQLLHYCTLILLQQSAGLLPG